MDAVVRREGDGTGAGRRDVLAVAVVAVLLLAIYVVFDLREGGRNASLTTRGLVGPLRYVQLMGGPWLVAMYVLDAVLAVVSATLLVYSFRAIRQRLRGGAVGACSTGSTLVLGFATFACPMCPLPILGTLGLAFFASTLPLGASSSRCWPS